MNSANQIEQLLHHWQQQIWYFLPDLLSACLILLLFWLLAVASRRAASRFEQKLKHNLLLPRWVGWILYGFFMMSGIFLALDAVGLTPFLTHLLAGAGIVGVVAGLALKDVASNAFSGLLVRSQRPFAVGDWVSINNTFGKVTDIGMLASSVQTITGQVVGIPNQLIYNNNFTNYSTLGRWRVVIRCGLGYGTDLEQAKAAALDEMGKLPHLLAGQTTDCYFTEIGSSAYLMEIRYWIAFDHHEQFLTAQSEGIMRLKRRFEQENIVVAYNVTSLDFGVSGGVNLGDVALNLSEQKTVDTR